MTHLLKIITSSSLLCAIGIGILQLFGAPVSAETMTSESFQIQFGNFNMTSGEKSSTSYKVTDTVGQTAAGQFTGSGYLVKSGFQYIYPFENFSLQISSLTVDLGELNYGSFNTGSHNLTVTTTGAGGYSVQTFEQHPLRLQSGTSIIPDTTCDGGTCSETTAAIWTTPTNAGFGFTISGDDIAADFISTDYFRQFADISNAETMQTIMSGSGASSNQSATITYKASPQGNQPAGVYETQIIYTAIPAY